MSRRTRAIIASLVLVPCGAVCAKGKPPAPWVRRFDDPKPLKVVVKQTSGSFTATNKQLGVLRKATTEPLWDVSTLCQVQTKVRAAEDGFDVTYTVSNQTAASLPAPTLVLPGIMLGDQVEFLDHTFGCKFQGLAALPNGAINSPGLVYPAPLYSPVMVLRDDKLAVGVSLKYPVLQYRHSVELFAARWPLATDWYVYLFLQGTMAPGESREYVTSVRFSLPDAWIHTVRPYRDYFWSLYGSKPRYTQDLRPVYGVGCASQSFFYDNPRGFHPILRPDLDGWQKTIDELVPVAQAQGYRRMMFWTPSGLYGGAAYGNNFAPQFMSEWSAAQAQTTAQFKRLQDLGVQTCFWWGHSTSIADQWEDLAYEWFDFSNPAHRQIMLNEWTLAVQRGADGAGLDGFEAMPLWDQMSWLETLFSLKPDALLVAESACSDVLHLQMPFWLQTDMLPSPHLLADYLVPGREFWVHLAGADMNITRANEVISWGMTVNIIGSNITANEMKPAITKAMKESDANRAAMARSNQAASKDRASILRKALQGK